MHVYPFARVYPLACLRLSAQISRQGTDKAATACRAAQADLYFFVSYLCCRQSRCLLRFLCCTLQFLGRIRCCLLHPLTLEHLH